jgi:hypothetical protein
MFGASDAAADGGVTGIYSTSQQAYDACKSRADRWATTPGVTLGGTFGACSLIMGDPVSVAWGMVGGWAAGR